MARYIESACRQCRRESTKLFLKGNRCTTEKCSIERRNYAPGQHGKEQAKFSEYKTQLREKQKVKRVYGLLEKQFRLYFERAEKAKGITGENLLQLLERRLDSVVYYLGFADSRRQARQLVLHRHFLVNAKRVNLPSFIVKKGDTIEIVEAKKASKIFKDITENAESKGKEAPSWLSVDRKKMKGVVSELPTRENITLPVNEQLIVELYSK